MKNSTQSKKIGKTLDKSIKLRYNIIIKTYIQDNSKDVGIVLKQSIDSGSSIESGTAITITVNK